MSRLLQLRVIGQRERVVVALAFCPLAIVDIGVSGFHTAVGWCSIVTVVVARDDDRVL